VLAEKIGSTVRVLELLELQYEVGPPRHKRERGNQSPRVVYVKVGDGNLRVYNNVKGHTWANEPDGTPTGVRSIEELYSYLIERQRQKPKR
jgi:hypothetical protein